MDDEGDGSAFGSASSGKGAREKRTARRIIISEAQPGPALDLSSKGPLFWL